ncbi:MAG: CDP-alcohol phosphatidyltransferase family protein [bacterium]
MKHPDEKTTGEERWQTSLLANVEKKALLWIAPKLPEWITPDMLTFLGLIGIMGCGLSYYIMHQRWWFLILASIGLVINWLGDSLDGTLARVRNRQRPKYGYYLDHLVDAFGITCLIFGLAYSGIVSQPVIWLVMALFLIASINTYLATNSVNVFKISYQRISTTEARVLLIIMNTVLIFAKKIHIFGWTFFWLDFIAGLGALFLFIVTIRSAYLNLRKLDREERAAWKSPPKSHIQ